VKLTTQLFVLFFDLMLAQRPVPTVSCGKGSNDTQSTRVNIMIRVISRGGVESGLSSTCLIRP
jgi:hypothetical protein